MKKDILAIITFLTTGFLFYLVQTTGGPETEFSAGDDCTVVESVAVTESVPDSPQDLTKHEKPKDS